MVPGACHVTERYANHSIEADHGWLKSRLRPMRPAIRCLRVHPYRSGRTPRPSRRHAPGYRPLFIDAFTEANGLATEHYPGAQYAERFIRAAQGAQRAWQVAVDTARHSGISRPTPHERVLLHPQWHTDWTSTRPGRHHARARGPRHSLDRPAQTRSHPQQSPVTLSATTGSALSLDTRPHDSRHATQVIFPAQVRRSRRIHRSAPEQRSVPERLSQAALPGARFGRSERGGFCRHGCLVHSAVEGQGEREVVNAGFRGFQLRIRAPPQRT